MDKMRFMIPCLFGLEGIVGNELKRLNMKDISVENGHVLFSGDFRDMARANLWIRSGERVLIKLGEFPALTFSELFDRVKELPWEQFIPKTGAFPVKGYSLQSQLHSVPDCQRIIKKAVVERLKTVYHTSWFEESGARYQIQFSIMKNSAALYLDTSGPGLHKRGYRANANQAPLRETLAAAMVELAHYRGRDLFCDPFCGSGTILIEAAMIAQNRAPGLLRRFDAEAWEISSPDIWRDLREDAKSKIFDREYELWGGDIDEKSLILARSNAVKAGVSQFIRFDRADARNFSPDQSTGTVVTNPPYGERMLDLRAAEQLYREFGKAVLPLDGWNKYIITSHEEFERHFGKKAVKRRKLYNGMIKCELYMYYKI